MNIESPRDFGPLQLPPAVELTQTVGKTEKPEAPPETETATTQLPTKGNEQIQKQKAAAMTEVLEQMNADIKGTSLDPAKVAADHAKLLKVLAESTKDLLEALDHLPGSNTSDAELIPIFEKISYAAADLGFVFNVAAAVQAATRLREIEQELTNSQAELTKCQERLTATPPPTEAEVLELNDQVMHLKLRISGLEERKATLCVDTSRNLLSTALSASKGSVKWAEMAARTGQTASAASQAANLALAAKSLGLATYVLSMGFSAYELTQDVKEYSGLTAERDKLLQSLTTEEFHPAVVQMIELRLMHLEEKLNSNRTSTVLNAAAIGCSGLATAGAATQVAILAGAGVGATAATALSLTGIGGVALGTAFLIGGLSYAAYKNRDVIRHTLSETSLTLQGKWVAGGLSTEEMDREAEKLIHETETELAQLSANLKISRKKFEQAIVEELDMERDTIFQAIDIEAKKTSEAGLGSLLKTVIPSLDREAQLRQKLQEYFKNRDERLQNELARFDSSAGALMADERRKLETLTSNVHRAAVASIKTEQLGTKKAAASEAKAIAKLCRQFSEMKPEEVKFIAEQTKAAFKNDPEAAEHVKAFMRSQGHGDPDFDKDPVAGVFRFLTRPGLEQEAA